MLKRWTALFLLALGGVYAGHAVGYTLVGQIHLHSTELADLHSYLPGVARLAVPLAALAFGWLTLSGSRKSPSVNPGVGIGSLLALQIGVYGVQEVLERVVSGRGVAGILAEPVVWGGLVAQVLVAVGVLAAVRFLKRVAVAALLFFIPQGLHAGAPAEFFNLISRVTPRIRQQAEPRSLRGPPTIA
ncbi:MAG: hypothetical protein IIC71_03445 [Acidobacteria bacterium]|nr:hypothetical protein [Acidobacteriota bacterium]